MDVETPFAQDNHLPPSTPPSAVPIATLSEQPTPSHGEHQGSENEEGDEEGGDEDDEASDEDVGQLQSSRETTVAPSSSAQLSLLSSDELPFVDVPRNRDDWPDNLKGYGESLITHEWSARWTELVYLFMDNERLSLWQNPVSRLVVVSMRTD